MTIKKGDFIEIDYVGRVKDTNEIFDLTKESVAKENNVFNPRFSYKPIVICVGEGELLKGLDEKLIGKDKGEYKFDIKSEEGFGKKNPQLLKLVPMKVFSKEKLRPFPGLHVNIDGFVGTVRSVSGGRVIVDFNHPLAGRDLFFQVEIKKIIKDEKEKVESIAAKMNTKFEVNIDKEKATIKIDLDDQHKEFLKQRILALMENIKEVVFEKI